MKHLREIDVAVVGGGPAGVSAAAAAAFDGKCRVMLIEAGPRLGGAVTGAMHRSLCGLYAAKPTSPIDTLNGGIQRDVVAGLIQTDPANVAIKQLGRTWVLEFGSAAYQSILERICAKPNIERRMNARLTAVRRERNHISAIQCDQDWIDVKAVIDCTGAGALMQLAGEDVMLPADLYRMLGGYAIYLRGLQGNLDMLRLQVPYVLSIAVAAGSLPQEARFTMFHPGPGLGEGICKLAVRVDLPDASIRQLAADVVDCLRSEISAFSSATVIRTSDRVMARDGRRLKGMSVMTEADILNPQRDGASLGWWPIETWDAKTGPGYLYPPEGRPYAIPDAVLCSSVIDNLFAAGTCLSATAGAAASLRASGICLATGEAAGRLARVHFQN